ncbi:MAG: IclR family transcriptional regulator [Hyphomicrobiaceae bacterium]|nr:MAG: IclR family transcriptional regulator [Hyphomicrobiaceae bacterium]
MFLTAEQVDKMANTERANTVHSLERGLAVLQAVAMAADPIGITDISRKLGLAKGSVARLVATLVNLNFLVQACDSRKYQLGLKLWELGSRSISRLSILDIARPVMKELHEETGETVHLTILSDKGTMVFLDKLDSTKGLRPNIEVGAQLPMHCVANGKAMLAYLPRNRAEAILGGRLRRYTSATITSKPELAAVFADIRERGYAVNNGEFREDVSGVAAVIRNEADMPVAALGISLPSTRMTELLARQLGELVAAKAGKVSGLMGNPTPGRPSPAAQIRKPAVPA